MAKHWLDTEAYPFAPHYYNANGHQLHYIDEGEGDILLFVHGTPSWSFDFRHLILDLRQHYRCIAIDHIGFGLSDKPAQYDYSTQNHARTLERFIRDQQLPRFTLVVHDFGGPIGIWAALQFPEKMDRLIVLNSWLWSAKNDPDYRQLTRVLRSPLLPFLYRYFNFSPRFVLPQSFGDHKISRATRQQYTRPFAHKNQRNGTVAFVHSLLHDQDWFEEIWQSKGPIAHRPTLLIWGMKDPVVKSHHLEKFKSGFLHATVVTLDTCGHFPQEETPERVISAVRAFLASDL